MENIILQIRQQLQDHQDVVTKQSSTRFFKEPITVYGVEVPLVNQIGRRAFDSIKHSSKTTIFSLCEELWQSAYFEEAIIACNWSYYLHEQYQPEDFAVFYQWIRQYVSNWATCDTLCNHSVGTLIEMYPQLLSQLIGWTQSQNRWLKRASAVSLIIPARHGKFLKETFTIADKLLTDPDDLVQKGYGWLLKAASQSYQSAVYEYVVDHKSVMPRTALRYAIEKMPPDLKAQAMAK